MVCKVLLVGAGSLLRKVCGKHVHIVVWDKERVIGGRMSTNRSQSDSECIADFGAQYITSSPENFTRHNDIYAWLTGANVLEPLCSKIEGMKSLPQGTKNFVAPNGMSSLVKHFLNDATDETHFGYNVVTIHKQGKYWLVETESGVKDMFDIVILTMPVPQVLQLQGSLKEIITKNYELEQNLKSVKFSSRYALCLFFDSSYEFNTVWDAKYIYDSEIFRYISFDNKKRNRPALPPAVVFHTTIEYGENNAYRDLNDVQNELVGHVGEMFPDWPEPAHVRCQRWQYSQVLTPYTGQPGCLTISEQPLLVAGGDSFTSSHVDGCISSAFIVADTVGKVIKTGYE